MMFVRGENFRMIFLDQVVSVEVDKVKAKAA
jgi:hypothetical protein